MMARSRSRSRSRSRTQSKSRSRTQSRSRSRSRSRSKSRSRSHSRSRSRSPRWKHRSFSPAFRSQEQFKGKPFQDNHRGEFRGFRRGMRRPMQRRVEDWKRNQTNSRFPPHENVHHRNFEPRPPSPNFRRSPSFENLNRPFRNFSPPRGVGNRRYPRLPPVSHPPRYTEQGAYKDNEWNFHEQKTRGRYLDDKPRPFRGGRGWRPFRRPFSGPFQRDERWHENDNFRHRKSPSDEYLQPHRRSPEGFVPRDSFHKRFPEEREFKDRGPIPKRAREVERHEARDPPRRPRWTPDRSPPFHRRGAGRFGPRARLSMERARSDGPAVSKVPFNYSQKPQRYPDGKQSFDGQAHKFTRLEEQKANAPTFLSRDKEVDNYNDKRVKPTDGGPPKINKKHPKDDGDAKPVSAKVKERGWKEDGDARCIPNKPLDKAKKDQSSVKPVPGKSKERVKKEPCDLRFVAGKLRDRVKKEADAENDPDSTTSAHEKSQPPSELKAPGIDSPRTKSFTVQVDMKKRVDKYRLSSGSAAERQLSQDLVAASRKEDHFHPVFEHIDSATPSGQNSPKSEFIQEVITITHQVKANYFKSSELTLHERFSKLKDKKVDDKKEAAVRQDPEIHRRIDISLADLQNKRSNKSASEQIRSSSGVLSKVKPVVPKLDDPLSD